MKCIINSNNEITDFWEDDSNAPEGALSCDSIPSVSSFIDTDGNLQHCYTLTNGEVVINSGGTGYNLSELRSERNKKLAETDWVVTMHKELGTNIPTAMKTYRQALRDITDDATSLDDVTWPEKP
jgi:hypothetical protein